jgi:transposase-like protein
VLGVDLEGQKEVLGLWVAQNEGAKFWPQVLTELKNRGVKDVLIACLDGLKGFPEAIEAVYSRTELQLCIGHLVRASLNYVPWKLRQPVASDLKPISLCHTRRAMRRIAGLPRIPPRRRSSSSTRPLWQTQGFVKIDSS